MPNFVLPALFRVPFRLPNTININATHHWITCLLTLRFLDLEVIFKLFQFLGRTLSLTSPSTFDSQTCYGKNHMTPRSVGKQMSLNMTFDHQQLCDIDAQSVSRAKNKPSGYLLFTKSHKMNKKCELCHIFLVSHK